MDKLYQINHISANSLLDGRYYEASNLYMYLFGRLPNIQFIGDINGEKAFEAITATFSANIIATYTYRAYNKAKKKNPFNETVLVLNNNCIIELNESYCEINHDGSQEAFVNTLLTMVSAFKERRQREPLEINMIVRGSRGLELKSMEIKRTKLSIDLFYEDDFKTVDTLIQKRLNKKNDKGIVMLHGLPGTGKTSYVRYLIGKIKKRVLFLSPALAETLMNPELMELLIDNPETVIVIEDAENILMDRRVNGNAAVSNLLNISDGLLADFLNVQLICTFNSSLTMIDSALMRKGRLIGKYEFGKLSIAKAQALSNHLGFSNTIHQPMTVAEIANQNEMVFENKQVNVIGFRRRNEPIEN